jgi:hypothetical protein
VRPLSTLEGNCEVAPHCEPHCVQPGVFPSLSRRQLNPVANTRVLPILLTMRSATLQILPLNSAGQGSRPPLVSHGSNLLCVTKERVCLSVCLSVYGSHNLQIIKDASSHFDSSFSMTVALWHCGIVPNVIKIGICLILRLSIACVSDQCILLFYKTKFIQMVKTLLPHVSA